MAEFESKEIYKDLKDLMKEVIMAGYAESMTARDKVDFLLPIKNDIRECMRCFIRAARENRPKERLRLKEALDTEFAVTMMDLHIADDQHIWRGPKDEHGNVKCAKRILDIVPRIDAGIQRWINYDKKGRPAPEAGCGSII